MTDASITARSPVPMAANISVDRRARGRAEPDPPFATL